MNKKNPSFIKGFYRDKSNVLVYDQKRFGSVGGKFVNKNEVDTPIQIILEATSSIKKVKILDLGSGSGRMSLPLKKSGFDVYCLDSSQEMIKILSKYISKDKIIYQSAFDSTKYKNYFDAITSLRFFDHFKIQDQKKIVAKHLNSLKNNGFFQFTCLNKFSLEYLSSFLFKFGQYNYYYSVKEYQKLFDQLDLKIVKVRSVFVLPRGIFMRIRNNGILFNLFTILEEFLSKLFPTNGGMLVYLLQKK